MDADKLNEVLHPLRAELAEARRRADNAAAEVAALERAIEGIEFLIRPGGLQPRLPFNADANGAPAADEAIPRGKEAVRRVLMETTRPVKANIVVKRVIERGWIDPEAKNPQAAIRVALRRLAETDEVEKVSTGMYLYRGGEHKD